MPTTSKARAKYRELRWQRRLELLKFLGNLCWRCGFDDVRALQIDHINGGGRAERKELSTERIYQRIRENRNEYQLLCANCNWIKKYERQESKPRKD
jgi:hypothetical protein